LPGTKSLNDIPTNDQIREYVDTFVQRRPWHLEKDPLFGWFQVDRALGDRLVSDHLIGRKTVGSLGPWYPEYGIIDVDDTGYEEVERFREELGMDSSNSMLSESESPDSWHILYRPVYREKPATRRLLQRIMSRVADQYGVEHYPRAQKGVRLPFGPRQRLVDLDYAHLRRPYDKLWWFWKLDEYELGNVSHQIKQHELFDSTAMDKPAGHERAGNMPLLEEGRELLEHGLQETGSRHEAQFKVLYVLWRQNMGPEEAVETCWNWIQNGHNGFSQDILTRPDVVRSEIERQAQSLWRWTNVYPDKTHNYYHGYLTAPDIPEILSWARGSLPRARLLFGIVRYSYPRRIRESVRIHSDKLKEWGSRRTYLQYIDEFKRQGLIERVNGRRDYAEGQYSKELHLHWPYRSSKDAVLVDGRSPGSLEETMRAVYEPRDARVVLLQSGMQRRMVNYFMDRVYPEDRK
jgi:hypothetical protein